MDTQTRRALKEDKLVLATQSSMDWLQEHRSAAIRWTAVGVVIVAAIVVGLIVYAHRSAAAEAAFGRAMDTYQAQLSQPGQPAPPGETVFPNTAARAKAAYQQFADVADRYGMLKAGGNARYFAGVTAAEMGQQQTAESNFQKVANGHDANLASLANLALANLYWQTNRTAQAIALYQKLIANPTSVVPANAAQLQLAALYETSNPAAAQRIYAQLKNDKTLVGEIAAQKLAKK